MRTRLQAHRLAAVLVIACSWTSSAAAADTVLSVEPAAPKLSAADGVLAWSSFDPAAGAWFLTIRRAGLVQRLPIAPRAVPFDVDLGHDPAGQLVVAYSRCDREPDFPPTGRGCDLYTYDLDAGRERRLAGASTAVASEYLPSLDGGRVAFARVYERRAGAAGLRNHLFVRRLETGRERKLPGGLRNTDPRTGPTGLDLAGRRLAFGWDVHGPAGRRFPYGASEVRVDELDGAQTLVQRSAGSALNTAALFAPTIVGADVRYGETFLSEGTPRVSDLRSYDLARGRRGGAAVDPRLAGVAADRGATAYVSCAAEMAPGGPSCRVLLREGAAFADADRELVRVPRPTTVATYRGWTAFSTFDASRPGYRLTLLSPAGELRDAGVAPRAVPFDVDLGPRPKGQLEAVYSRCRIEPRLDPRDRLPLPGSGRGCDVYRHAVAGGGEAKVPVASRPGTSEYLPTISGTRIAFARRVGSRAPALYAGRPTGGRLVRLAAGPRGRRAGLGPRALDLQGRRLALTWEHTRRGGSLVSELRLDAIGGGSRRLARAVSRHGSRRLLSPAFDRHTLSWVGRHLAGKPPSTAVSYDVTRRTRLTLVLPDPATTFLPGARYGHTDGAGWSLRVTDLLPQLLR